MERDTPRWTLGNAKGTQLKNGDNLVVYKVQCPFIPELANCRGCFVARGPLSRFVASKFLGKVKKDKKTKLLIFIVFYLIILLLFTLYT